MTISLLWLILLQLYFIGETYSNESKQFSFNVKRAISKTVEELEANEINSYYDLNNLYKLNEIDLSKNKLDTTALKEIVVYNNNKETNETIIYRNGILAQNFTVPNLMTDGIDSLDLKLLYGKKEYKTINQSLNKDLQSSPEKSYLSFKALDVTTKKLFRDYILDMIKEKPISKRIDKEALRASLEKNLDEVGVFLDFEFMVSNFDEKTDLKSNFFDVNQENCFATSFLTDDIYNNYRLHVNFPERNIYLRSFIKYTFIISVIFTLIIILTFGISVYQIIKQKKISEIKSDFINNMTHEFKTPIATINLALDAIRNDKIFNNKERVLEYLQIIKDENKRMHNQVENVLRISKLDRNDLDIEFEDISLNELVDNAISHVKLIVEHRNGKIKFENNTESSFVSANKSHFTNVIINILDNAIKYSEGSPDIKVQLSNQAKYIELTISDKGKGMSKQVQKRIFDMFYREHTGDIHNVKGHGLGLPYVKKIVNYHGRI